MGSTRMRVIFCCVPQTGHITPLLPLAEAFSRRGDEVILASGNDATGAAASSGLSFRRICPEFGSWFEALRARTRGVPGDGLAPERVPGYFTPRLFGEIGLALTVDGLIALCREIEPALLVFDPYLFAAPLAAAATGSHPVLHGIGPAVDPAVMDLVSDAVSPVWREFGMDVPAAAGLYSGTNLTVCPPTLDPGSEGSDAGQPLRPAPLPLGDPAALPVAFVRPELPVVYLTMGTFSNTDLTLFRRILHALKDEPVNVLATVGRDNEPSALGRLPDNARVEQFIPQAHVLPHCSAVIHHAGAGTMFGVLAHGLPSVALPQSADNFDNARLMARSGAAHTLSPGEVTSESVRLAVRSVLDSPSYRRRAAKLAEEVAAMPSPDDVAASLAAARGH